MLGLWPSLGPGYPWLFSRMKPFTKGKPYLKYRHQRNRKTSLRDHLSIPDPALAQEFKDGLLFFSLHF